MLALVWPLVFSITGFLYAMILITLPFSTTVATIFLFTLIAFWSRLPGVGFPAPFWILYMADVIDIFAMLIAINIGGVYGGIMSLFANLGGRACGMFTPWGGNLSDAIAMFFTCLIIPYVHPLLGGDVFLSMMAFTTIRVIFIVPLDLMGFYPLPLPQYMAEGTMTAIAVYFLNGFYARVFGDFFDNLLKKGVAFSWELFAFASVIILGSYLAMSIHSKKIPLSALKNIKNKIKEEWDEAREIKRQRKEGTWEGTKDDAKKEDIPSDKIEEEKKEKKKLSMKTIKEACPFCKSDLKGNARMKFYCEKCNLLFSRRELKIKKVEGQSKEKEADEKTGLEEKL